MTAPMYNDGMLDEAINSPGYKRLWSADRSNMDQILEAICKIHAHSAALAKAA